MSRLPSYNLADRISNRVSRASPDIVPGNLPAEYDAGRRKTDRAFRGRDLDIPRLCSVIRNCRKALQYPREQRAKISRQLAGSYWSEEGSARRRPVNLIGLYRSIVGRSLVPKVPRVLLSTRRRPDRPAVEVMQRWMNQKLEAMDAGSIFRHCVDDAFTFQGVVKVGLATPADAAASNWGRRAGEPYMLPVDFDDWVQDVYANSVQEIAFMGHRVRVPFDSVRDSKIYSSARNQLTPTERYHHNDGGDERVGVVGWTDSWQDDTEIEDMIDLWEVYVARHRLVVTLASDQSGLPVGGMEPLRVVEWTGHDEGPYAVLGFGDVPGARARPRGPMLDLIDLDEDANGVYRKLARQAHRQKEVLPVRGGQDEDIQQLLNADDGTAYKASGEPLAPAVYGGPNAANYQFFEAIRSLFDFIGGNLAVMGGRAPQAKTARQEALLNENASAGVSDMADAVTKFVAGAYRRLAWFYWHDPFTTMRTDEPMPFMPDLSVPRKVTPEARRRGRWEEINLRIDPYSFQYKTPGARLAEITQTVTGLYVPLAQEAMRQGVALDLPRLFAKVAEYQDNADLDEILTVQEPPQELEEGGPSHQRGASGAAPATERRYVRENVSAPTADADNKQRVAAMFGSGGQGRPQGIGYNA